MTKPLTMVLLIGVALAIDTPATASQTWFVVALVASLAGDIFLMLTPERFAAGLASFLVAHLAYIAGLSPVGFASTPGTVTAVFVTLLSLTVGRRVFQGASSYDARLSIPVALYIVVISAMTVVAAGTASMLALVGALLFYASDGILGWNRFVAPLPHGRLLTRIPYHVGQALLVLALTRF